MKTTRDKLILAAKNIILNDGLDKATFRAISAAAGVNLASINYHFGSREKFLTELLFDSMTSIEQERLARLKKAAEMHRNAFIPIEVTLRCFYEPVIIFLEQNKDVQQLWSIIFRQYGTTKIYSQAVYDSKNTATKEYYKAIKAALPQHPDSILIPRFAVVENMTRLFLGPEWLVNQTFEILGLDAIASKRYILDTLVDIAANGLKAPAPCITEEFF